MAKKMTKKQYEIIIEAFAEQIYLKYFLQEEDFELEAVHYGENRRKQVLRDEGKKGLTKLKNFEIKTNKERIKQLRARREEKMELIKQSIRQMLFDASKSVDPSKFTTEDGKLTPEFWSFARKAPTSGKKGPMGPLEEIDEKYGTDHPTPNSTAPAGAKLMLQQGGLKNLRDEFFQFIEESDGEIAPIGLEFCTVTNKDIKDLSECDNDKFAALIISSRFNNGERSRVFESIMSTRNRIWHYKPSDKHSSLGTTATYAREAYTNWKNAVKKAIAFLSGRAQVETQSEQTGRRI